MVVRAKHQTVSLKNYESTGWVNKKKDYVKVLWMSPLPMVLDQKFCTFFNSPLQEARFLKVCRYDQLCCNSLYNQLCCNSAWNQLCHNNCYDQLCCKSCYDELGCISHWTQCFNQVRYNITTKLVIPIYLNHIVWKFPKR